MICSECHGKRFVCNVFGRGRYSPPQRCARCLGTGVEPISGLGGIDMTVTNSDGFRDAVARTLPLDQLSKEVERAVGDRRERDIAALRRISYMGVRLIPDHRMRPGEFAVLISAETYHTLLKEGSTNGKDYRNDPPTGDREPVAPQAG